MKKQSYAVFDIDGTLVRWQLYHAVVDKLAKRGLLGKGASEILHEARMRWKNREHAEAFKQYEKELIRVYEQALHDLATNVFDEAVGDVVREYKEQVYTYTRDLAQSLKRKGYMLLAISGSHGELIEQIAKIYGFDDWVGTHYERKDGTFSGKRFIASLNKRTILNDLIKKHDLDQAGSIAVGDSASDIAMLEMVEEPIAFNPDRSLYDEARKRGWKIIVERKNVVYELRPGDGSYILA
jgi:HAD superfamily hydrolase (TIGR01490 family)